MINHSAAKKKILEYLTARCETVASIGVVLPTPSVFPNKAAYFSNVVGLGLATQKALETTPIKFCAISVLIPFEDEDPITEGCADAPKTTVTYNFAVFRQYEEKRVNESDLYGKRVKQSKEEFDASIDGLYTEFNGRGEIPDIDENLIVSLAGLTAGLIEEREPSGNFISEILYGHSVDLQLRVSILPITD